MQLSKIARQVLVCALLFVAIDRAAAQGLLVTRTDGKIQFVPVFSLAVNGKEKIHLLGPKPELSGPVDKLPAARLGSTIIQDIALGVPVQYQKGGGTAYLYPDGIPKKTAPPPVQAWKESAISYKKSKQDKVAAPVPSDQFLGFLSGGVPELADLCMDQGALALLGGKTGAFAAQLELTAAAVNGYGTQPEMAQVERKILDFMRARQSRFDDGIDSTKSLTEGLRFAELSAKAYPTQQEHQQIRKQLADSKAWLDKRVAVLRALSAGSQWDAFLLSYRQFEKHEGSFPDLTAKRKDALKASLDAHWKNGKERLARSEYRRAYQELRSARERQPSNPLLSQDVSIAWVQYSREVAVDHQNKRKLLSPGEQDVLDQLRVNALRYKQVDKLDEALSKIGEAEKIDPEALSVLLAKAEILLARNEVVKAVSTLDQFDQLAVDKERDVGNKLRGDITFQRDNGIDTARKKLDEHWKAGRYHQTLDLAKQSLQIDDKAPAILYYAGVASMATRHRKEGVALLTKYLETSNNLDADVPVRAAVARMLTGGLPPEAAAATSGDSGETSWYSGSKIPAGVFYDPLSGMFVPRIDHITASNKMYVKFGWEGDRLKSIMPSFEKVQQTTNEKPFYFTYADSVPHVIAIDAGETPRKIPKDPDAMLQEANVVLANNPLIDAPAIQKLTGKAVTIAVAGNRYYHPFVWERPYYFALTYDDQGRVEIARQLPEKDAANRGNGLVEIEFEWTGLKLASVTAYSLDAKGVRGGELYSRTMNYQGDKLMGEDVRSGSRDTKIKYVWNGGTLVSADCGKDEAMDNRARDVFFVGGGSRGRK